MEKVVNTSMKKGRDLADFFMENTLVRAEIENMGEPIFGFRFKETSVKDSTSGCKDIKLMMFHDSTCDID